MNFENAFIGPQSIQVCHLRPKISLTTIDHLRGQPRPIQRGRRPPRVPPQLPHAQSCCAARRCAGVLLRPHGSPTSELELRHCSRSLAGAAVREEEGDSVRSSRSSAPLRGPCSAARGRGRPPAMEGREEGLAARRSLGSDDLELRGMVPHTARSRPPLLLLHLLPLTRAPPPLRAPA